MFDAEVIIFLIMTSIFVIYSNKLVNLIKKGASAALYINVDVRNGNLIKVLIFVDGEMRYRLCIWKYSVC